MRSGVAIPNLREGTLTEEKVVQFLNAISILGLWMNPNLPSTPYQWLHELDGQQIFDGLRIFKSIQWNESGIRPRVFFNNICMIIHKLGCHGDNHNCNLRDQLAAFKVTDAGGTTVGFIGYTQRSVTASIE